jgi:hypothetical protein
MEDISVWFCIFVFWVICGLITAYIYKQKGRSEGLGCIGGFLLGPIGIILALISSADREKLAEREKEMEEDKITSGELKKCPYCAELIKSQALVCKHCSRDLTP